ncbi:MAG: O-antigen ligase family protein, partial [Patescibacteria group bacterium]
MANRLTRLITGGLGWGLPLFLVVLPLQTRWLAIPQSLNGGPWEYGTVSVYGSELLLIILALAWIWWYRQQLVKPVWPRSVLIVAGALLVWELLSIMWAGNQLAAASLARHTAEAMVLAVMLSSGAVSQLRLAIGLVISATPQAVVGWWQVTAQMVPAAKWLGLAAQWPAVAGTAVVEVGGERWLRAYGAFPHPNMLAIWLALGLVAVIWLATQAKTASQRWLVYGAAMIMVPTLVATFSRAGYIAAAVGMLVVLVRVWQQQRFNRVVGLTVGIMAVMATLSVALWWPILTTRVDATSRLEQQSIDQRLVQYDQASQLIQRYPIGGVGLSNMTAAVVTNLNATPPAWWYQPVHSLYALPVVELGIVGGLLWAIFLVTIAVTRYQSAWVGLGAVLLAAGLFDHFLWSLYPGVMMLY